MGFDNGNVKKLSHLISHAPWKMQITIYAYTSVVVNELSQSTLKPVLFLRQRRLYRKINDE